MGFVSKKILKWIRKIEEFSIVGIMDKNNTKPISSSPSSDDRSYDQLEDLEDAFTLEKHYRLEDFPKVSIVIPTCNVAELISMTLTSVLSQDYPDFEVIIVDSSEDRTLEIIKSFRSDKIRIYSIAYCKRYEMLNKGLSHAEGEYVNFLFPGDFYLHRLTIKRMMALALEQDKPCMVYCGTLLRDSKEVVKILYRKMTLDLLQRGQQPTSLQSCWFRTESFRQLGKFNPNYSSRGGYELMCRFLFKPGFRFASISQVLIDYDLRVVTREMVWSHFWETIKTIYRLFGFYTALKWLFIQKDIKRYFKLWMHGLKVTFLGR